MAGGFRYVPHPCVASSNQGQGSGGCPHFVQRGRSSPSFCPSIQQVFANPIFHVKGAQSSIPRSSVCRSRGSGPSGNLPDSSAKRKRQAEDDVVTESSSKKGKEVLEEPSQRNEEPTQNVKEFPYVAAGVEGVPPFWHVPASRWAEVTSWPQLGPIPRAEPEDSLFCTRYNAVVAFPYLSELSDRMDDVDVSKLKFCEKVFDSSVELKGKHEKVVAKIMQLEKELGDSHVKIGVLEG
ncbi:uncharacterized protein G2W53_028854 [Senna tora]|uniref:Uncharacterized protein n=1 Tax=Senna tora TaxID=362788 RepID=A0A834T3H6_9FABA|nr:uncharacterized protein G2W53_028854 [Senna tora]